MSAWVKIPNDWCIWSFTKWGIAVPSDLTGDAWAILMEYEATYKIRYAEGFFVFKHDEDAIHFKLTHL